MKGRFAGVVAGGIVSAMVFTAGGVGADERWYVSATGGVSVPNDQEFSQGGVGGEIRPDTGYLVSAAIGRGVGSFRFEGEVSFGDADVDSITTPGQTTAADGNTSFTAVMLNGYYDWAVNPKWTVFAGGGIGYGQASLDDVEAANVLVANDEGDGIAYQAKAGIAYRMSDVIGLGIGYRYFAAEDVDMKDRNGVPFSLEDITSHNVEATVRFNF